MKFTLEIEMTGAAFDGDGAQLHELPRLIEKVATAVGWLTLSSNTPEGGVVLDLNGNRVGKWEVA